jgi:uncharacterized membrane protein YkvA (DUF1232 family)
MADFQEKYSDKDFWKKLQQFSIQAGKEVVEKALILYFAAQRPETPLWAKTTIYSALAYLILPTDAIPDFIPLVGYADDLSTLIAAATAIAMSITPEVKKAAKQKVHEWFGDNDATENFDPVQPSDHPIRVIPIE